MPRLINFNFEPVRLFMVEMADGAFKKRLGPTEMYASLDDLPVGALWHDPSRSLPADGLPAFDGLSLMLMLPHGPWWTETTRALWLRLGTPPAITFRRDLLLCMHGYHAAIDNGVMSFAACPRVCSRELWHRTFYGDVPYAAGAPKPKYGLSSGRWARMEP